MQTQCNTPPKVQPTQEQMFYQAHRKISETNEQFLWLVQNGLTREDLATNIARRPSLWQRFEGWLDKLPSRGAEGEVRDNLLPA